MLCLNTGKGNAALAGFDLCVHFYSESQYFGVCYDYILFGASPLNLKGRFLC